LSLLAYEIRCNKDAAEQFAELHRSRLKIGTMDLKIAAIALSKHALLLSCNPKDFKQVSGLIVEDWTRDYTPA